MKITHINDDEIQGFIFDTSTCEIQTIKHIHSCEECKIKADNYSSLSTAIKNQPKPVLNINLAEQVFEQLQLSSKVESNYSYFIFSLIFASVGVVFSTLYLFKENIINLFSFTTTNSFMVSVVMMIAIVLILDLGKNFNKKINILNSY